MRGFCRNAFQKWTYTPEIRTKVSLGQKMAFPFDGNQSKPNSLLSSHPPKQTQTTPSSVLAFPGSGIGTDCGTQESERQDRRITGRRQIEEARGKRVRAHSHWLIAHIGSPFEAAATSSWRKREVRRMPGSHQVLGCSAHDRRGQIRRSSACCVSRAPAAAMGPLEATAADDSLAGDADATCRCTRRN